MWLTSLAVLAACLAVAMGSSLTMLHRALSESRVLAVADSTGRRRNAVERSYP